MSQNLPPNPSWNQTPAQNFPQNPAQNFQQNPAQNFQPNPAQNFQQNHTVAQSNWSVTNPMEATQVRPSGNFNFQQQNQPGFPGNC